MPEIDLMRVDQCLSDVVKPPPGFFDCGLTVDADSKLDEEVEEEEEDSDSLKKSVGRSTRRGRPPRTSGASSKASSPQVSRKRREDEDVCFVCFDGGSLVLCDRRGCPKAYHPACVKRTEAFFRSRAKWNCGWHICTACQKDSFYMCYTCPYSVCKRCVRSSEYVVVRENKGFCGICMKTIMLIENAAEANKEKVQVDFDDQGSWEYLFKIYWVSLKEKLSLSLDDLTKARNPWKSSSSTVPKRRTNSRVHEKGDGNSPGVIKVRRAKVRKTDSVSVSKLGPSLDSNSSLGDRLPPLTSATAWATDELLDFVRFMKHGDISVLSKYDVQTLVLEHVRRNNLQTSPQIMCDARLMRLFGKERVDHFEMLKLLDSHFLDQERFPVTDTSAGGVTETMSFQVDASRGCDRLNTSEQYQDRFSASKQHQGESQQLNMHNCHVRPSSSNSRNHAVVKPETCAPVSYKPIDSLDTNMVWLYGDPDGKIHGPFSLYNLRQWNSSGHFPPELRIWRLGEQQNSSILLTDALNGQFHKTGLLQNHSIPKQEVTANIANDQHRSVAVPKLESRILDFSPNSVCTDQSVISSSNSVITRSSDVSNKSGNNFSRNMLPLDFSLSNERDNVGSVSLWNKRKVESPLLVQSPISCSLSLSTLPGNSNCSMPPHERWNAGQTDPNGNNAAMNACNQNSSLSGSAEKQVTATVQSCGQNWNAATPSSASNVWDSNTGLASFPDNQEIDFLDLFSPTFKFNFASTSTEWQPIVAGPDECDESVSDLLAEVEAMESQKRLPSPTSTFRGPEELVIRHSINDSFSPAEGHSPALDVSKGDSMSSTNDLQMHSRSNSAVHF
ncbi:hypothetical protein CARUB_v10012971mg [Capsella rubella]|uniref:PHD-type domain-containing protein n=1 Tax=Capsella rubella TaxID=81985 RepID=R0HWP9_9BRAS|nr:zinc finger CCCH domain-containing protein 44 [Capsella rubella]EOA29875.1 hypothetical protein CARUB_v10012971mg [Capsella rubella]